MFLGVQNQPFKRSPDKVVSSKKIRLLLPTWVVRSARSDLLSWLAVHQDFQKPLNYPFDVRKCKIWCRPQKGIAKHDPPNHMLHIPDGLPTKVTSPQEIYAYSGRHHILHL